jgi:large subunit ribosomal protein L9
MKVFFLKDFDPIGKKGELKDVSVGYANNFLIPSKIVLEYCEKTKGMIQSKIKDAGREVQIEKKRRTVLSDQIDSARLVFKLKSNGRGELYGSVGAAEISRELMGCGIKVSKNQILIEKPLKKIGSYSLYVKLSSTLQPTLRVRLVAEDVE